MSKKRLGKHYGGDYARHSTKTAAEILRKRGEGTAHHPDCTDLGPHFVGPSFGQIGFFLCQVPEDLTNHTRCMPPYDHEHGDHR